MDIVISCITSLIVLVNSFFGAISGFDDKLKEAITNEYEMKSYEYFTEDFWGNEEEKKDYIEYDTKIEENENHEYENSEEIIEELDNSVYNLEIRNSVITNIGEGNKIVRMYLPNNMEETMHPLLEVEEITNYEEAMMLEDTYAFIIGKNPLYVSDINGEWDYNTLIMPGLAFKYPNFLEVSRGSFTHEVPSMVLTSEYDEVAITVGSYIAGGQTVDSIYNAYSSQYESLTKGDNWVFSYSNEATIGRFNFNKLDRGRANEFFGRYPIYLEEKFSKALEESVFNFEGCDGFPYLKVD